VPGLATEERADRRSANDRAQNARLSSARVRPACRARPDSTPFAADLEGRFHVGRRIRWTPKSSEREPLTQLHAVGERRHSVREAGSPPVFGSVPTTPSQHSDDRHPRTPLDGPSRSDIVARPGDQASSMNREQLGGTELERDLHEQGRGEIMTMIPGRDAARTTPIIVTPKRPFPPLPFSVSG